MSVQIHDWTAERAIIARTWTMPYNKRNKSHEWMGIENKSKSDRWTFWRQYWCHKNLTGSSKIHLIALNATLMPQAQSNVVCFLDKNTE